MGREVLRSAAEYLTPVTLELGGKSPCIVDATAKLPLAARRIVFGKYLNCGQTCVAPDYVLCDVRIRDRLVGAIRAEISRQFGENPLQNPDYGKIINEKHFHRLLGLMDAEKIVCGGQYDEKTLRIAPTVMTDVDWSDAVMEEEIFGPILPVVTYNAYDTEKSIAQNDFSGEVLEPKLPREILWIGRSAVWRNIPIRWRCISSVKIKSPETDPGSLPFWRRLHQRHHYSSRHQRHALRWRG